MCNTSAAILLPTETLKSVSAPVVSFTHQGSSVSQHPAGRLLGAFLLLSRAEARGNIQWSVKLYRMKTPQRIRALKKNHLFNLFFFLQHFNVQSVFLLALFLNPFCSLLVFHIFLSKVQHCWGIRFFCSCRERGGETENTVISGW